MAQFEVRLRVADNSGAWRLVVSSPTGAPLNLWLLVYDGFGLTNGFGLTDLLLPVLNCLPSSGTQALATGSSCSADSARATADGLSDRCLQGTNSARRV